MVSAVVPRPPWCPTPGAKAHTTISRHDTQQVLKLEKIILITINLTIICTTCRRRRCLQARMGRLQWFRRNSNSFVLWTCWHCTVARFPQGRRERQSEYGQRGGNFGFAMVSTCVILNELKNSMLVKKITCK
jgi:hypothetical protein